MHAPVLSSASLSKHTRSEVVMNLNYLVSSTVGSPKIMCFTSALLFMKHHTKLDYSKFALAILYIICELLSFTVSRGVQCK